MLFSIFLKWGALWPVASGINLIVVFILLGYPLANHPPILQNTKPRTMSFLVLLTAVLSYCYSLLIFLATFIEPKWNFSEQDISSHLPLLLGCVALVMSGGTLFLQKQIRKQHKVWESYTGLTAILMLSHMLVFFLEWNREKAFSSGNTSLFLIIWAGCVWIPSIAIYAILLGCNLRLLITKIFSPVAFAQISLSPTSETPTNPQEDKGKIFVSKPSPASSNTITPLLGAIISTDIDLVHTALSEHPEHLNTAYAQNGNTPLHVAALNGKTEIVKLLLAQPGIDKTLTNKEGKTARDLAQERNFHEIAELLK